MTIIKTNAQKARRFPLKCFPTRIRQRRKTGAEHQVLVLGHDHQVFSSGGLKGVAPAGPETYTCLRTRAWGLPALRRLCVVLCY